jgi:transposase
MRVRIQNALQALALSHAIRRGSGLWSEDGQYSLLELKLRPFMEDRRNELMALYRQLQADIEVLDARVAETAEKRPLARMLMTHPGVGPNTALATEVYIGDPTRFAMARLYPAMSA